MAHNLEYLLTRPGMLKIATIVFGIISFSVGISSYVDSPYTEFYQNQTSNGTNIANLPGPELELFHFVTTGLWLFISFVYLLLYGIIYDLCESKFNRILDTVVHMMGSLLIFCGGTVVIYSAVEIEDYGCSAYYYWHSVQGLRPVPYNSAYSQSPAECHEFGNKVVSGVFSILNSMIYCGTAITIFITKDL